MKKLNSDHLKQQPGSCTLTCVWLRCQSAKPNYYSKGWLFYFGGLGKRVCMCMFTRTDLTGTATLPWGDFKKWHFSPRRLFFSVHSVWIGPSVFVKIMKKKITDRSFNNRLHCRKKEKKRKGKTPSFPDRQPKSEVWHIQTDCIRFERRKKNGCEAHLYVVWKEIQSRFLQTCLSPVLHLQFDTWWGCVPPPPAVSTFENRAVIYRSHAHACVVTAATGAERSMAPEHRNPTW